MLRPAPGRTVKMAAVHVLDDYYLAFTLLITIAYQLFFFSIAFSFKFDKLTDFAGGTNFVVIAIITLAFSAAKDNARNIVVSLFIMVWGCKSTLEWSVNCAGLSYKHLRLYVVLRGSILWV